VHNIVHKIYSYQINRKEDDKSYITLCAEQFAIQTAPAPAGHRHGGILTAGISPLPLGAGSAVYAVDRISSTSVICAVMCHSTSKRIRFDVNKVRNVQSK